MSFLVGFAAGVSIWFWLVLAVAIISMFVSVEYEKYSYSTSCFIISAALLIWLAGGHPLTWIAAHQTAILIGVAVYLGVGVIWGVVKWYFFLLGIRDKLVAWRRARSIPDGQSLSEKQLNDFKLDQNIFGVGGIPPQAAQSKARITYWMIYWPFSMPWTLINEPVKRFFNFMYNRLAGMLQGMSNRLFKGLA